MTRVVHLTSVHRTFDTRIFHKECHSLSEAGYEVVLVTPHSRSETRDGIQIRALPRPTGRLERMARTARLAVREALALRGDLYHLHDPELLPWWRWMAEVDVPVVYDMHEHLAAQVETKEWLAPVARPIVAATSRVVLRWLLRDMAVVFAERSYRDYFPWIDDTETVQNMPVADRMAGLRRPPFDRPTIGYIGGVTRDRGSVVTLRALALLRDRGMIVDWECIGPTEDEHREELESLRRELQIDGVRWRGYLPPPEGWAQVAPAHLGMAVLRRVPNYVASYPTKLFEYMALGLPVVVSDIPLYREIVEEIGCGVVVDPEDPSDVADGIARILGDEEMARRMAERGRSAALSRFSWSREAEKLVDFYGQLLQFGPTSAGHDSSSG